MGYTNYGYTNAMDADAWAKYTQQCRVLFARLWSDKRLVLSSFMTDGRERPFGTTVPFAGTVGGEHAHAAVFFNGNVSDEEQHEPFFVSSDMPARSLCFTKTNLKPYDFAVKCAMILLAELGGVEQISSDGDCSRAWFEAIDWLVQQPMLPDVYPRSVKDIHSCMCDDSSGSQEVMRSVLERKDALFARWVLSSENPDSEWRMFRRMGRRMVARLRARIDARHVERGRLWVPRFVSIIVTVEARA